jgi:hypothetical protein
VLFCSVKHRVFFRLRALVPTADEGFDAGVGGKTLAVLVPEAPEEGVEGAGAGAAFFGVAVVAVGTVVGHFVDVG